MIYFRSSATADLGSLATIRRQCAGYLPVSRCGPSMTACWFRLQPDPTQNRPSSFSDSGPTLSYDIFVFRFYEAADRDLRQSAISCPWRLHLKILRPTPLNGCF